MILSIFFTLFYSNIYLEQTCLLFKTVFNVIKPHFSTLNERVQKLSRSNTENIVVFFPKVILLYLNKFSDFQHTCHEMPRSYASITSRNHLRTTSRYLRCKLHNWTARHRLFLIRKTLFLLENRPIKLPHNKQQSQLEHTYFVFKGNAEKVRIA